MLSFYNLSFANIFKNRVNIHNCHHNVTYENNLGERFGLRQNTLEQANIQNDAYLITNTPKNYINNRNQNSKLRFVPYWSNVYKTYFVNQDDTNLNLESQSIISSELDNMKNIEFDYFFNICNVFPEFKDKLVFDLTCMGDTLIENVKIHLRDLPDLNLTPLDKGLTNSTRYKNLFLANTNCNEWIYYTFMCYRYEEVSLYYKTDTEYDNRLSFIIDVNNIISEKMVIGNYTKRDLIFNEESYNSMLCMFKFTINQLSNLKEDVFVNCLNENEMIQLLKSL